MLTALAANEGGQGSASIGAPSSKARTVRYFPSWVANTSPPLVTRKWSAFGNRTGGGRNAPPRCGKCTISSSFGRATTTLCVREATSD